MQTEINNWKHIDIKVETIIDYFWIKVESVADTGGEGQVAGKGGGAGRGKQAGGQAGRQPAPRLCLKAFEW